MSRILKLFLVCVVVVSSSCATIQNGSTLSGKWRLTETLADPGDGSGKWNPVSTEEYLTFNSDGTVNSTEFPSYQTFTTPDSGKLEFTSSDNRKQLVTYRIEGNTLILTPQCIEACGSKYVRAN